MDFMEFTGKDTEEALALAQDHFELPLDRLEIEVLHSGSAGIFGLGSKKAKVRVKPAGPTAQEEMAEVLAVVSGEPPPKPRPAAKPTPAPEPVPAAAKPAPAAQAPTPEPQPQAEPSPRREAQPPRPAQDDRAPQRTAEPPSPELLATAKDSLERMVAAMESEAQIKGEIGERGIELEIVGGETGIIIGRRGQTLEALQYLVTRIVSHQAGKAIRVSVDTGGYRQHRFDSLADLAQRMGEKAIKTGRPVLVGPLNSQERRVVHMALRGEQGLSTVSRGRGDLKKVVISPR